MNKTPLSKKAKWKITRFWFYIGIVMPIVVILLGVALGPIGCGIKKAIQSSCMQTAHSLDLAFYSYANDNNGKFPEGKTSTEVFQKLLDGGYINDPSLVYFRALGTPGKVQPTGKILKPENVSWDVTSGVDASSPDDMPVVFLTGYEVNYQAGAAATFRGGPPRRTWQQWWYGVPNWEPFMAYADKGGTAKSVLANDDGLILNFIPADFDPKGKTYRQLTP